VRLGSKVHYCIKGFFGKQLLQESAVLDCAMDESMSCCRVWGKILKIGEIASVRQSIKVDNTPGGSFNKNMADEVCPNKSGATGYQQSFCAHSIVRLVKRWGGPSPTVLKLQPYSSHDPEVCIIPPKQLMCQQVQKEHTLYSLVLAHSIQAKFTCGRLDTTISGSMVHFPWKIK